MQALKIRSAAGIELWHPVSIYDLVAQHNIDVWFLEASSLEGMYSKSPNKPPAILLGSERPMGRQVFTCAHEFGHHVFKHGIRVDSLIQGKGSKKKFDPDEFLADSFAGFLLMSKAAVENAFSVREWDVRAPAPYQVFVIAGYLGVGYSTLIQHMSNALRILPRNTARELLRHQPKTIRSKILGHSFDTNLVIVDSHWKIRPIDIQVGDLLLINSRPLCETSCLRLVGDHPQGWLFQAATPGTGKLQSAIDNWAAQVRVSSRGFHGWAKYLYQPKGEDDE